MMPYTGRYFLYRMNTVIITVLYTYSSSETVWQIGPILNIIFSTDIMFFSTR